MKERQGLGDEALPEHVGPPPADGRRLRQAVGDASYLLLGLVTGTAFFSIAVTLASLSAGLFVLIIGIPVAMISSEILRWCAEVERMRRAYAQRRNLMLRRFAEMGLPCFSPGGAFYMFPDIRKYGLTSKEFALRLLEVGREARPFLLERSLLRESGVELLIDRIDLRLKAGAFLGLTAGGRSLAPVCEPVIVRTLRADR